MTDEDAVLANTHVEISLNSTCVKSRAEINRTRDSIDRAAMDSTFATDFDVIAAETWHAAFDLTFDATKDAVNTGIIRSVY